MQTMRLESAWKCLSVPYFLARLSLWGLARGWLRAARTKASLKRGRNNWKAKSHWKSSRLILIRWLRSINIKDFIFSSDSIDDCLQLRSEKEEIRFRTVDDSKVKILFCLLFSIFLNVALGSRPSSVHRSPHSPSLPQAIHVAVLSHHHLCVLRGFHFADTSTFFSFFTRHRSDERSSLKFKCSLFANAERWQWPKELRRRH